MKRPHSVARNLKHATCQNSETETKRNIKIVGQDFPQANFIKAVAVVGFLRPNGQYRAACETRENVHRSEWVVGERVLPGVETRVDCERQLPAVAVPIAC